MPDVRGTRKFDLHEFDPSTVGDNRICLFVGPRGTGKSTAMRAMLYQKRGIPSGICMSETEESNKFWQKSVPLSFIYPEYDAEAVRLMIKRQRQKHRVVGDSGQLDPTFWVAEDVMGSGELSKCKHARRVFVNGRQWNVFALLALQYVTDLPPKFRGNVDFVFAFRPFSNNDREKLYDYFFSGAFDEWHDFRQTLKQTTEDHMCLVLNNTVNSNDLEKKVFFWKAPVVGEFRAGDQGFWDHHFTNYKDAVEWDSEEEDPRVGVGNHRKIVVNKLPRLQAAGGSV
ncbi:hypothetical protein WJX74_001441 [Apatococcus lobatus]|uniref:Uncharacterized protein n=1 Tax=Apatococcus lobatus TaxID=904363 RepID=A0AAW1SFX5_9CHLO